MSIELYKKHRPATFEDMVGQDDAVAVVSEMVENRKVPHAILFSGPSGCGKTTLARILRDALDCSDADLSEMNCADFKGIDTIRDIRSGMNRHPMGGAVRVYIVDECHKLTNDAQNAILKILEDTPPHVYFMLATTNPQKLLKTIITRCTEIRLKAVGEADLIDLVAIVAKREKKKLTDEVVERIAKVSDGSPRKALVYLHQIIDLGDEDQQLNALLSVGVERQGIELARALLAPKTQWGDVAKLLKELDEEPEDLRRMVLGYAQSILLSGKKSAKAFLMLQVFRDHTYDCGKPGLTAMCYEVVNAGS